MKNKILISLLFFLLTVPTANAQVSHSGTMDIDLGNELYMIPPLDFSFGTLFREDGTSGSIYRTLSPTTDNEYLWLGDTDQTRGYDVTVSLSNFTTSNTPPDVISYANLSFVTLSQSLTSPVDGTQRNVPLGDPNVVVPQDCNWDPANPSTPNMEDACDVMMEQFIGTLDTSSTLTADIDETSVTIDLVDASGFAPATPASPELARIGNDFFWYEGSNATQLTGVQGIDGLYLTGTNVQQYSDTSIEYTVLQNTSVADIGIYTIGFGFRFDFDQNMALGDYSANLTFTLIPN